MGHNPPKARDMQAASKAYDTQELIEKVLKAIKDHKLIFFSEIHAYLACSRATLYNHGLDKVDGIKDALERNRISIKAEMRRKWYESDNATLQLAAYRLNSSPEEHRLLNQAYLDHTTKGEAVQTLDLSALSEDAIEQLYNQLRDDADAASK